MFALFLTFSIKNILNFVISKCVPIKRIYSVVCSQEHIEQLICMKTIVTRVCMPKFKMSTCYKQNQKC